MITRRTTLSFLFACAMTDAARAACTQPNSVVTVCPIDGRDFRIIEGSLSPDKRFGFGWTFAASTTPVQRKVIEHGEGGFVVADDGPGVVENALIRLSDGAVAARSRGKHFGDKAEYNHTAFSALWSANGRYVLELNTGKWSTSVGDVYHVSEAGDVVGPFRLLELVRAAALKEMKRTAKKPASVDVKSYTFTLSHPVDATAPAVEDSGLIRINVSSEVPKRESAESFEFAATIAIKRAAAGLFGEVISMKRVQL